MLKNYDVDVGTLDKRIVIQKKGKQQTDTDGFPIGDGWDDYKIVWASKNGLYGKEFWSAKAVNAEDTVNFIFRWQSALKDLNADKKIYRIKYKNIIYDIEFVDNIQEANMFYKVKAKAVH